MIIKKVKFVLKKAFSRVKTWQRQGKNKKKAIKEGETKEREEVFGLKKLPLMEWLKLLHRSIDQ